MAKSNQNSNGKVVSTRLWLEHWPHCYSSNLCIPCSFMVCQPNLPAHQQVLWVAHILNTFLFFKWFPSLSIKNHVCYILLLTFFTSGRKVYDEDRKVIFFPLSMCSFLLNSAVLSKIPEQGLGRLAERTWVWAPSYGANDFWNWCCNNLLHFHCAFTVCLGCNLVFHMGHLNLFGKSFQLSFSHKNIA